MIRTSEKFEVNAHQIALKNFFRTEGIVCDRIRLIFVTLYMRSSYFSIKSLILHIKANLQASGDLLWKFKTSRPLQTTRTNGLTSVATLLKVN